jgi:hypothetical protein
MTTPTASTRGSSSTRRCSTAPTPLDWWDKLRVRVTAPANSVGEIHVTAERSTD